MPLSQDTKAHRPGPKHHFESLRLHKTGNVLAALPKSAHPGAKKALAEIWRAEDRQRALEAAGAFRAAYGAKFPKAVVKIIGELDQLLAFCDYPAGHWVHLRTTNPIVIWSPRSGVRHVGHEGLSAGDLPGGRGYLPLSITRIFRRNHACSAGAVARLVA